VVHDRGKRYLFSLGLSLSIIRPVNKLEEKIQMKRLKVVGTAIILVIVISPIFSSYAQQRKLHRPPVKPGVMRLYKLRGIEGIAIPVLKRASFLRKFGDNRYIPRTNHDVVQLARFLYSPTGRAKIREYCGETAYGTLFAALQSPDISDEARDAVGKAVSAGTPYLKKTYYRNGSHFRFRYTDNDSNSNNNVTLSDVQKLDQVMNVHYAKLTTNFRRPKGYILEDMAGPLGHVIDVKIYDLGKTLGGQTNSTWDYIELNSQIVTDDCRRSSISGHELFHRVQYSYGYESGMAYLKWATEGTAVWSQKFLAPDVGDWMSDINRGLKYPNQDLIRDRSYNAAGFWVFLGERGGAEAETIKQVWAAYEKNGKNMKQAVEAVVKQRVPYWTSFDQFAWWWSITNFFKDSPNAPPTWDYFEDELVVKCGDVTHGPIRSVPQATYTLRKGTEKTVSGIASPYGTNYYLFKLKGHPMNLEITFSAATQNFSIATGGIRHGVIELWKYTPVGGSDNLSLEKAVLPGKFDEAVVVVMGNPNGGAYSLRVAASELEVPKRPPPRPLPPLRAR
jgi:hypothetical protein